MEALPGDFREGYVTSCAGPPRSQREASNRPVPGLPDLVSGAASERQQQPQVGRRRSALTAAGARRGSQARRGAPGRLMRERHEGWWDVLALRLRGNWRRCWGAGFPAASGSRRRNGAREFGGTPVGTLPMTGCFLAYNRLTGLAYLRTSLHNTHSNLESGKKSLGSEVSASILAVLEGSIKRAC